jgi:putative ABC transport system permease protein
LKESLLLGAIGTAAGLPIGVLIARYGSPMAANAAALNFRTPKVTTTPLLSLDALGLGALAGLMAAILAAAIPAARLARKQPVAALTMRGREGPGGIRGFGGFLGLALLLVSAVLVVWQQMAGANWLGNLTTAALTIAACAFSAPLIRRSKHVLLAVWQRTFGASGELAALHITENSRRVALTVAILGIGLGAILMFGILGWSFERSLVQQVTARLQADLVVTSAFESGGWVSAPIGEGILEEIEATPGIVLAAGTRVKDLSYSETAITLYAYDNGCFLDRRMCDWRLMSGALPDAMAAIASGVGAIVSPSFVHTFGLMPGSTIVLDSPRGPQEFRIVGVTDTQPDTAIIISRARFRTSWNDTFVTWAFGILANREQAPFVEAALSRRVGDKYRVRVRPVRALIEFLAGQAHEAFRALYVMEAVALLLVFIGIGDALAAGVLERVRQFAMMRAIGVRRSRVFSIIILEGSAIAVLGLSLAAATGAVLSAFWVNVQFPAVLGWSLRLHFPFVLPLVTFVASIGLCLVASLLPGLRAAGLSVARCLRDE